MCGSSHIRSVEISVEPRNFRRTLDVYLLLFFFSWASSSKLVLSHYFSTTTISSHNLLFSEIKPLVDYVIHWYNLGRFSRSCVCSKDRSTNEYDIPLGKSSCITSHVLVFFVFPPYHRAFIKGLCQNLHWKLGQ